MVKGTEVVNGQGDGGVDNLFLNVSRPISNKLAISLKLILLLVAFL